MCPVAQRLAGEQQVWLQQVWLQLEPEQQTAAQQSFGVDVGTD